MSTNVGTVLPDKNSSKLTQLEASKFCEIPAAPTVSVKEQKEPTVTTSQHPPYNAKDLLRADEGASLDIVTSQTKSPLVSSMGQFLLSSVQTPEGQRLLEADICSHKRKKRKDKDREREHSKSSNYRNRSGDHSHSKDTLEKKLETGKHLNHSLKSSHSSTIRGSSRHNSNKSVIGEDCTSSKSFNNTSEENKCRNNSHSSNFSKMRNEDTSVVSKTHDKKVKVSILNRVTLYLINNSLILYFL